MSQITWIFKPFCSPNSLVLKMGSLVSLTPSGSCDTACIGNPILRKWQDLMDTFHLSVGIFVILIFWPFLGRESCNFCIFLAILAIFPTLWAQKMQKNLNHKNSHTQMKDMNKILPQTKNWTFCFIF